MSQDLKVCTICKDPKLLSDFNNKKSSVDGKQPQCRECGKKKSKDYYNYNKEFHKSEILKRKKKQIQINRQFVYGYVKSNGCLDCPEKEPCCLDFDHVRGEKRENISIMINSGFSLQSIKDEIDKCELRCSNCHRKRTSKDQGWYRNIDMGL